MSAHKIINRTKDSGNSKSYLKKGLVPGVIYGKGTETIKIAIENKLLNKLMQEGGFHTKVLNVDIDGKKEKVLAKELQFHPVTDRLIHFDLLRVHEDTIVTVDVPVVFLNQDICPGLKKGGVLNLVRRSVELKCNANDIPEKLTYDLNESEIGDTVKISNIQLNEGVKPTISGRDFVIATLVPPTIEIETKPAEETTEEETTEDSEKNEEKKEEKTESKEQKEEEKK